MPFLGLQLETSKAQLLTHTIYVRRFEMWRRERVVPATLAAAWFVLACCTWPAACQSSLTITVQTPASCEYPQFFDISSLQCVSCQGTLLVRRRMQDGLQGIVHTNRVRIA